MRQYDAKARQQLEETLKKYNQDHPDKDQAESGASESDSARTAEDDQTPPDELHDTSSGTYELSSQPSM